jgi:hypothetical protein
MTRIAALSSRSIRGQNNVSSAIPWSAWVSVRHPNANIHGQPESVKPQEMLCKRAMRNKSVDFLDQYIDKTGYHATEQVD